MELAARTAAWRPSGTPLPYDAEVAWLEFGCAQAIWIGEPNVTSANVVDIRFSVHVLPHIVTDDYYYVSGWWQTNKKTSCLRILEGGELSWLKPGSPRTIATVGVGDEVLFRAYSEGFVQVNGVSVYAGDTHITSRRILGASTTNVSVDEIRFPTDNGIAVRYSGYTIYDNITDMTPEVDLIPVRVGQTGYMYDRISGSFYGNAGTGSFTLGPDKL